MDDRPIFEKTTAALVAGVRGMGQSTPEKRRELAAGYRELELAARQAAARFEAWDD
jgi:hypothetical protein